METFQKRQKEMRRLEKQRDKEARRAQRKNEKPGDGKGPPIDFSANTAEEYAATVGPTPDEDTDPEADSPAV